MDNSFVLWGLLLVVGLMARSGMLIALYGAALVHLALDFPLHNNDSRAHFWPLTNWKFISPVSYWDPKYYGHIVGPSRSRPRSGSKCLSVAQIQRARNARIHYCFGVARSRASRHLWYYV